MRQIATVRIQECRSNICCCSTFDRKVKELIELVFLDKKHKISHFGFNRV